MAINYREILDTYERLQDEANAANQRRYDQLLGTIRGGRESTMGLLEGLGESELGRIDQRREQERGRAEQDLISRGLGNTTIRESVLRGVEDDAGRLRNELTEDVSRQKAGVEQAFTSMLAQAIEGRTDRGPDLGAMAQLLQQAASGPDGTLHTGLSANARAGRSAFGTPSRYFNRGGGGGGGGGGAGFQPATGSSGGSTSGFRLGGGGGSSMSTGGAQYTPPRSERGGGVSGALRGSASQAASRQASGGSGGGFGRIGPAGSLGGGALDGLLTEEDLRLQQRGTAQGAPDLSAYANPGNQPFDDLAGLADLDLGGGDDAGGGGGGGVDTEHWQRIYDKGPGLIGENYDLWKRAKEKLGL
jgi:hypothetical protein